MKTKTGKVQRRMVSVALCLGLGAYSYYSFADIFVTNEGSSEVVVFANSASGNQAPLRQFNTSGQPRGIAVDTVHNEIFVATQSGGIHVFDINATGAASPLRTISGGGDYQGIHFDAAHNEVFVVDRGGAVEVYDRLASGAASPLRTLTLATQPRGVYVNADELYVTRPNQVLTYARTASGAASALRTIESSPSIGDLSQVTFDATNGELVVANHGSSAIRIWPVATNGIINALRSITGAATQLDSPRGVAVCPGTGEYVATSRYGDSVTVYAPSANGDAAPVRTISGAATGLNAPRFVAITGSCGGPLGPVAVPVGNPLALALLSLSLGVLAAGWARWHKG